MAGGSSPDASASLSPKDISLSGPSLNSESLLSYPAPSSVTEEIPPPVSAQPRRLLKDRLYVGNLHPTVDEYTLLQVFSKFGKISKLDFLFHKSGPMKGKPRGYAFVEYSNTDDAAKALLSANDKLLRGRKLVVTFAHQAPLDESHGYGGSKSRRGISDIGKPTTLSLLKSAGSGRSDAKTEDKIAKMEAKLRQMEQSSSAGSRAHPSLPPKPVGAPTSVASGTTPPAGTMAKGKATSKMLPLPSLPIVNQPSAPSNQLSGSPQPQAPKSTSHRRGGPTLTGVKIVKHKNQ